MVEKKELAVTEEKVVEIEMVRLRSFENHPFKVRADSQMIELQESVKKYGILNPLIVRSRKDDTYEIISGHRRKFAAEKIGYRKVPVIIRVLKDEDAVVSMVDSNLQREMMPSLGMMTINALACADSVLIPVQAAYLPVKGLQQLIKTISRVKKQLNPKLKIEGILLTMVYNRTNYARDISLMVYDTYSANIKVFATEIPMSVRASEVSVTYKLKLSGGDIKAVQGDSGHAQANMVLFIILNHSNCGSFFDIYYNTQLDKYIRVIYYAIYQIDIWRAMMNRKNIRKLLLIISLLLFPITIWYMSPYLIIQGAMEGIITGSFVVFTCMLLGSIFCGRLFCAWLCPMGGMQECLFAVNAKNPKQGWKNYIKYAIWTIWIIAVILCFIFRKKEITVNFFYMTDHGISISNIYNYVIYYGIIFLVLIPAVLFGKRIFCHYFCWMAPFMVLGTKIRRVLHLPGLHIKVKQPDACVSCGKCNRECPMGIKVSELIKDGQIKNAECIQCGACIDGCPKKVLSYGMMERGKKNGNRKEK